MQKKAVLSGDLQFLNLGELLQLIGSTGGTGTLSIASKYASEPGMVYFINGNPIHAANGTAQGLDGLYALFGWTEGVFEFNLEAVDVARSINESRMGIILNGLKMLDDGQIEKLGPASFEIVEPVRREGSRSLPVIRGPLVDYMYVVDEEAFPDGRVIVDEGKHGSWIWVILDGVVEVLKETPNGQRKILRIGEGSFVGSFASLLTGDTLRNATTVASGDVHLGVLDSQRLYSDLQRVSMDMRRLIISMDKRLKQLTNRAVARYLKKNKLAEFVQDRKLVIKQGRDDPRNFLILQGQAFIVRYSEDDFVPLIDLSRGDFLGRLPFIDLGLEPYSASVFGSKNLKLGKLDAEALQAEFQELPATIKHFIENTATCIAATTIAACDYQRQILERQPSA